MDKDKTMTKNLGACRRVQGMLAGEGMDRPGHSLCAGGFKKQSKKMGWDQPLEALKGELRG